MRKTAPIKIIFNQYLLQTFIIIILTLKVILLLVTSKKLSQNISASVWSKNYNHIEVYQFLILFYRV